MKIIATILLSSLPIIAVAQSASVLIFDETEPQNTPGISRMIFSEHLLRIDDGNDASGYILYNSKTKVISSVSHEEKTVLEIKRPKNAVEAKDNDFRKTETKDDKAPKIAGNSIWQVDFYHGMKRCGTVNTVKDLFKKELLLLQDYYQTLQMDAKVNIDKTPVEFQTGCYINNYVNHVTDYYQHGFPIAITREDGFSRLLKGFQNKEVDESWLSIPKGYSSYSVTIEKSTNLPKFINKKEAKHE